MKILKLMTIIQKMNLKTISVIHFRIYFFFFVLGNSSISWKSITREKYSLIIRRSRISNLNKCTKQVIQIKRLVNEIFNINIRINIRIDNKPC